MNSGVIGLLATAAHSNRITAVVTYAIHARTASSIT
jgi:hypothetical protein